MDHSDCWSFYLAHRASRNKLETLRNSLASVIEDYDDRGADAHADRLGAFLIVVDEVGSPLILHTPPYPAPAPFPRIPYSPIPQPRFPLKLVAITARNLKLTVLELLSKV